MPSTKFTPPYPLIDAGGDGVQFDGTDIPEEQKRTLGSYLSSLTHGFTPGFDSNNPNPYTGQDPPNHANPYSIAEGDATQNSFTSGLTGAVHEAMDLETQPSALFGDVSQIVDVSPKGQARSNHVGSGPDALDGVVGSQGPGTSTRVTTPNASRYAKTLGEALRDKNLNSGQTIVNDLEVSADNSFSRHEGIETARRVRLGDSLGKSYDTADIKRVDLKDLTGVAQSLMARAMGAPITATGPNQDVSKWLKGPWKQEPLNAATLRAAAAVPESLQDLNRTMASGGLDAFETGEAGEDQGRYTTKATPVPYGPDAPYTGFDTGSAAFTAFVTSGVFIGAVLAAALLGSAGSSKESKAAIPAEVNSGLKNNRRLKFGKFRYEEPPGSFASGLTKALDIASNVTGLTLTNPFYSPTNPTANYGDCVVAGLASFLGVSYGIDKDLILGSGFFVLNGNTAVILAETTARLTSVIFADPVQRQYYMNIIRTLNRNAYALGDIVTELKNAGLDLIGAGGGSNSIFDSTLFKFVNTLAQIGDLVYTQAAAIEHRGTDIETSPAYAYGTSAGFDLSKDKGASVTAKGFAARRVYGDKLVGLRGSTLGLADLPSAHLIPAGSTQSYRNLMTGNVADRMKGVVPSDVDGKLRISAETVRSIESALDAEYMPFYFHDLRTNEIISFHAFLDDITDSYTANYNSTSGYGRIENVQTYKDTKRSVACTFHIVGMNPQDFDYMWWQINKLTTMVYPQWSKGRELSGKINDSDFKFTQPFSQIPTATPVIRLRVGDLIRSNYSRFNLKRIFGYQSNDFGQSVSGLGAGISSFTVKPGEYYAVDAITGVVSGEMIKIFKKAENASGTVDPTNGVATLSIFAEGKLVTILVNYDEYTPKTYLNYDANGDIRDFYDAKNNFIVRSFESAAGMGLAAVVTQLGFTWNDALWGVGEDGPGNRAPRSCKVQMSFEPIHDIAPGLDHEGFNRAPIYPVGRLVNGIVEGGEKEPYGAGTTKRTDAALDAAESQIAYEETFKPNWLGKLF